MKYALLALLISSHAMAFVHKNHIDDNIAVYDNYIIVESKSKKKLKIDTSCSFGDLKQKDVKVKMDGKRLHGNSKLTFSYDEKIKRCNVENITLL